MNFGDAAHFKLPFGKHRGRKIDEVAASDAGLRYLAWLRDDIEATRGSRGNGGDVLEALRVYLDDPVIARDLAQISKGRE